MGWRAAGRAHSQMGGRTNGGADVGWTCGRMSARQGSKRAREWTKNRWAAVFLDPHFSNYEGHYICHTMAVTLQMGARGMLIYDFSNNISPQLLLALWTGWSEIVGLIAHTPSFQDCETRNKARRTETNPKPTQAETDQHRPRQTKTYIHKYTQTPRDADTDTATHRYTDAQHQTHNHADAQSCGRTQK